MGAKKIAIHWLNNEQGISMKTIPSSLATLFASGNSFLMADCYKFVLTNGTTLRFTSFDADVTYSGQTWLSTGPIFERNKTRTVIGLEVNTLELVISPKDTDLIGSQSWLQAVCAGVLDGAVITLDRAFLDLNLTCAGTVNLFYGNTGQVYLDRNKINLTVNSPLDIFNIQMPKNVYQSGCQHTLFDSGCGANRATFTTAGSVSGSPSVIQFAASLAGASGRYNLGSLQFTSGVLAGTKRTVKSWNGTNIVLLNPLPVAPSSGDAFTVTAGCDKTQTTCNGTFSNVVNFKAFPFVPVPETAI